LVLDADNFAVQNPQFLFELDVFQQKGAIFWPDFWHPSNTIFNIHKQSLVWELIDVPFMNSFEQESGQLLVNRTRHADALNILMFYATSHPNLFHKLKLVWGDKDLFRLAWMKAKKEFEMVHFVPGSLGIVNHKRGRFCGMSMVQYDFEGQILFIHRNTIKLTNEMNREETTKHHIWQVLQEIKNPMDFDRIKSFNGLQLFQRSSCFGIKRYDHIETIDMIHVDNLRELVHLEDILLAYAKEAIELTAF
jgi:alpha 1,2-mannosyltransferase